MARFAVACLLLLAVATTGCIQFSQQRFPLPDAPVSTVDDLIKTYGSPAVAHEFNGRTVLGWRGVNAWSLVVYVPYVTQSSLLQLLNNEKVGVMRFPLVAQSNHMTAGAVVDSDRRVIAHARKEIGKTFSLARSIPTPIRTDDD